MKHLHILALALAFTQTSWAQTHQELVLDGGFEVYVAPQGGGGSNDEEGSTPSFDPYLKPQYWYFNSSLSRERTKTAHSGNFSIRVYPNGGSFIARDKDFNTHYIPVQSGAEYELTYWYQGTVTKPNILVYIDWYKGEKLVKKDERKAQKDLAKDFSNTWKKKTLTFKAPAGVESAALGFYIQSVYEDAEAGRYILIDDISMVKTKDGVRFYSEELFRDENQRELYSNKFSRLITPDRQLQGNYFRSDERMTRYYVSNSKGSFARTDIAGKNDTLSSAPDTLKEAVRPSATPQRRSVQ